MTDMNEQDRNNRILIVDDNSAIHEDFIKILGANTEAKEDLDRAEEFLFGIKSETVTLTGFRIDSAYQGQEGLQKVVESLEAGVPYALAFVDVRMPPGWDGIKTIKKIWAVDPDIQIVVCTAYSDYSWDGMIQELGMSDKLLVLKKPFDMVEVLQMACALTEKWHLSQVVKAQVENLEHEVEARTGELMDTQSRLEQLLAHSPVIVYSQGVKGEDLNPTWVSENIQQILGWTNEQWFTPGWLVDQLDPDHGELLTTSLVRLFSDGASSSDFRVKHQDGHFVWIHEERKLRSDSDGQPVQVVGVWTDVTKRRELEDQLRQSQKMEAIGQLAGGVAHDFNNLLTVIEGYSDLLLAEEGLGEEVVDSIKEISSAAGRAASLTRQLLAYGRKQMLDAQELDLNVVMDDFSKLLQRVLGESVILQVEKSRTPAIARVDRSMIEQVLLNLAVNSRDAMPVGGGLAIGVATRSIDQDDLKGHTNRRVGEFVCLRISDTGEGMAPEVMEHMFEPFFTTKDVGKGTGLGLATVEGIVRQHGGWLEVQSTVGTGTLFEVFLPQGTEAESGGGESTFLETDLQGTETILVVEDDPTLRGLVSLVLSRYGYDVISVGTGKEALSAWSEHGPRVDLLLADVVLPDGFGGRELAQRLESERPSLKTVYTSGYEFDLDSDGMNSGREFVAKPYQPQKMIRTLRECLDAA